MANTTLGGITLDNGSNAIINDNDCRKESELAPQPLYLLDSDQTDVFDFGGAIISRIDIVIADLEAEMVAESDGCFTVFVCQQDEVFGRICNHDTPEGLNRRIEC